MLDLSGAAMLDTLVCGAVIYGIRLKRRENKSAATNDLHPRKGAGEVWGTVDAFPGGRFYRTRQKYANDANSSGSSLGDQGQTATGNAPSLDADAGRSQALQERTSERKRSKLARANSSTRRLSSPATALRKRLFFVWFFAYNLYPVIITAIKRIVKPRRAMSNIGRSRAVIWKIERAARVRQLTSFINALANYHLTGGLSRFFSIGFAATARRPPHGGL